MTWAQLAAAICSTTRASSQWAQYTSATPSLPVLIGAGAGGGGRG